MKAITRISTGELCLLLLVAFSVLWKGGKSLETTWLLAGLASCIILFYWWGKVRTSKSHSESIPHIPYFLWATSLFFILWTVVSYIGSETRNYGLDEVLRTTGYVCIFLWVARTNIEREAVNRFERVLPGLLSIVTVVATIIGSVVYTLQPVNRFVGTFFDFRFHTDYWPNAWAEYILLVWPLMFLSLQRQTHTFWKVIHLFSLGLAFGGMALSYSRGAAIAATGQVLLLVLLFLATFLRGSSKEFTFGQLGKSISSIFIVAAIAGGFFYAQNAMREKFHDVQSVIEKVTFTASEGTSSISERAQFWQQATDMVIAHPIIGSGPYSFRFVQSAKMEGVLATSDHPHNVLLKLASERGLPAVLAFVLVIAYVLFFYCRSIVTKNSSSATAMTAYAVSFAGVMAHNMIDFNLQFVGIGLPTAIILGLLVQPTKRLTDSSKASFSHWKVRQTFIRVEVMIAIALLIVCFVEGIYLVSSSFGRHAEAVGNREKAQEWYLWSNAELFSRDMLLSSAAIALQEGDYELAKESLDKYLNLNSHDHRAWRLKGELCLYLQEKEEALVHFQKAYSLGKHSDLSILRLLLETAKAQNDEEVLSNKYEFDAVFSAYADAIIQNSHFIALSQNPEELMRVSRVLASLYPADSQRYKQIAREAFTHAQKERVTYQAKPRGILW